MTKAHRDEICEDMFPAENILAHPISHLTQRLLDYHVPNMLAYNIQRRQKELRNAAPSIISSREAPVDLFKKGMALDVVGAGRTGSEAQRGDRLQQGRHERPHFGL